MRVCVSRENLAVVPLAAGPWVLAASSVIQLRALWFFWWLSCGHSLRPVRPHALPRVCLLHASSAFPTTWFWCVLVCSDVLQVCYCSDMVCSDVVLVCSEVLAAWLAFSEPRLRFLAPGLVFQTWS